MAKQYKVLYSNSLKYDRFEIVPLRYEDRLLIMKWRNDQIYHLRQAKPLTLEDQNRYFDEVVEKLFDQEKPNQILFSFLEDGRCIGYGGLVHINWIDQHAEISFIMDTDLERDNFAKHWTTFLRMIEKVAFNQLKLHKIFTYAFDIRPHLYIVLENNGFQKEAVLKDHCYFEGDFKDVVIHSKWKPKIKLTTAKLEDSEVIFKWSSDPTTRENSFNSATFSYESHLDWFKKKLKDPNALLLIGYLNDQKIGLIRFDRLESGLAIIGVLLDSKFRGRSLSVPFIEAASEYFHSDNNETIQAFIKKTNIPSIKSFERVGFIYDKTCEINGVESVIYLKKKDEK